MGVSRGHLERTIRKSLSEEATVSPRETRAAGPQAVPPSDVRTCVPTGRSQAPKGLGGTLHQPLHFLTYRQYHKSKGPTTTRNVTSFAGMETCSRETGDFPVTLPPPGTGEHKRPGPHGTRQHSVPHVAAYAHQAHRVTGPLECPPSALASPWRGLRTRASAARHCPTMTVVVET